MYHTATTIVMGVGVEGEGGRCVQVLHNIKKKVFNFEIDIEAHFFTLLVSYLLLTIEELYTFERVEASFKTMFYMYMIMNGLYRTK